MLVFALLFSAVGWAQTPSNPTCCSHSYWTGRCTACPGYWYQTCNSGYRDADSRGCGFLGCETKCYNSCRYKNYGCGCNNSTSCHKRNCVVSGWSSWGSCSKACGTGTQSRTRRITTNAAYGGTACPSSMKETKTCNTQCCKVNCAVSGFGSWGSCSKACGTGTQKRTRSITRNASCGGTACPALFENRNCNTQCCAVSCAVSAFGGWGTCSKACGGGTQRRTRTVTRNASCNGTACPALSEDRSCNTQCCKQNCVVSAFGAWGTCSKTCGGGKQKRTRTVTTTASCGGDACPALEEERDCNTQCCKQNCEVGAFGGWGTCSATCGGGKQKRSRSVTTAASCGGDACPALEQEQECNTQCCKQNCVVGAFGDWGTCSATCGGGKQKRSRSVTTAASCGGDACPALEEEQECNTQCCAVDCVVGAFGDWGTCSATCGGGKQKRSRSVTTAMACGGTACPALEEEQDCNEQCCAVDCVVGAFGDWGTCSETCGGGKQKRSRSVTTAAACGGDACPALEEEQDCNTDCCPVPCSVSVFGEWGACDATCGGGKQTRTRSVEVAAACGGTECPALEEEQPCNEQACPTPAPTLSPTESPTASPTTSCKSAWDAAVAAADSKKKCKNINGKFKQGGKSKKKQAQAGCKHKSKVKCSKVKGTTADDKLLCLCLPGCAPESKKKLKGKKCKGSGTPL